MQFVIISGLSGAGKSRAADLLEDRGFYCVDNMPIEMLSKFAEFCISANGKYERVALVTDVRVGDSFVPLFDAIDTIKSMGCECRIIFLDSETESIIRRYKETRRPHPLARGGETLGQTVEREREILTPVRQRADRVLDTTVLTGPRLRDMLYEALGDINVPALAIHIMSFGFKYGAPVDADLVFDVRFLPNPFYIEEYREKTGLDKPVRDYVFSFDQTERFLDLLMPLIEYLLPCYIEEGKSMLTIAIGCTGGRHRSTAIATEIAKRVDNIVDTGNLSTSHRDIDKG